jgi:Domain of unknown function (DUF6933)
MNTPIHISKKLEKLISKYIGKRTSESNFYLGKWNANIFYVDRKKCWLFTNSETKFSIIIPNLKSADIKNITEIFTENLYSQLIYESILIDFKQLKDWIGNVEILPTDNDRKTIGTQNYIFENFKYWKYEFGTFENMPFRELTMRMNSSPTESFNWKSPHEKMTEKLNTCA